MRIRAVAAATTALVILVGLGVYLGWRELADRIKLPSSSRECLVQAEGRVALGGRQMANAATIAAVGVRRGMPERAVVVALATALQESKLENLTSGDRDSVGLFQQRPSQGWGTPEQIRDPRYAARKFYDGLAKVRGWEEMRVTDAAQKVQRSAFPEAYEKWADEAAVLTKALLGDASGAVACTVPNNPAVRGDAATAALQQQLRLDWGRREAESTTAEQAGGLALTVTDRRSGWRYAHWLVSHAADHGVKRISYGGMQWSAEYGRWATAENDAGAGVLVEVFADSEPAQG